MKPTEIKALQNAASILMLEGAPGTTPLDEAALGLSAQLMQWLAQRLRADAQHADAQALTKRLHRGGSTPGPEVPLVAPQPLRKTA